MKAPLFASIAAIASLVAFTQPVHTFGLYGEGRFALGQADRLVGL